MPIETSLDAWIQNPKRRGAPLPAEHRRTLRIPESHQTTHTRSIRFSSAFRLRERYRAVIRFRAKEEVSDVLTPKSVVEAVQ